jgi:tetratricopeptide (TPR) repeat protein
MVRYAKLGGVVGLMLGLLAGCGGDKEAEARAAAEQTRQQELQRLEQLQQSLNQKRQELAQLEVQQADTATASPETASRIEQLSTEIDTEATQFTSDLVTFFNADPPVEGEPLTEVQQRVVRMKSGEDMLVASEYIEEGGNYSKAIQIYEEALALDAGNPELQAALEEARANRFMTEERFQQAKKGMTEEQVRAVLGTPSPFNVREFEDQGVTAWFYPTNEQRAAAGVWFRPASGQLKVYRLDFKAIKAGEEDGGGEGAGAS